MSVLIAYRRRASALHATRASIGAAYGVALASAALIVQHPIVLAGLLGAVLAAGSACGALREMRRTLRVLALPILILTILVNVLVSRGGLTVFARLGYFGPLGQMNLTLEAVRQLRGDAVNQLDDPRCALVAAGRTGTILRRP